MDSKYTECRNADEIERFLLRNSFEEASNSEIADHLYGCDDCKKTVSELRCFYSIYFEQLSKPVTKSTFKFVNNIVKENIIVAGILLKPQLLDEMPGERHFTSQLIYAGNDNTGEIIDELENLSLTKNDVLIYVTQSYRTKQTTLYLSAKNKNLYSDIIFIIPKQDITFQSDKKGKIELGKLDFRSLDSQAVMIIPGN